MQSNVGESRRTSGNSVVKSMVLMILAVAALILVANGPSQATQGSGRQVGVRMAISESDWPQDPELVPVVKYFDNDGNELVPMASGDEETFSDELPTAATGHTFYTDRHVVAADAAASSATPLPSSSNIVNNQTTCTIGPKMCQPLCTSYKNVTNVTTLCALPCGSPNRQCKPYLVTHHVCVAPSGMSCYKEEKCCVTKKIPVGSTITSNPTTTTTLTPTQSPVRSSSGSWISGNGVSCAPVCSAASMTGVTHTSGWQACSAKCPGTNQYRVGSIYGGPCLVSCSPGAWKTVSSYSCLCTKTAGTWVANGGNSQCSSVCQSAGKQAVFPPALNGQELDVCSATGPCSYYNGGACDGRIGFSSQMAGYAGMCVSGIGGMNTDSTQFECYCV